MADDILLSGSFDNRRIIQSWRQVEEAQGRVTEQGAQKLNKSTLTTEQRARQLGFAFQRFGVTGLAAFGEIFAAIGPVGIAVGALTLGVVGLVKVFGQLLRAGVEALRAVFVQSVDAAKGLEVARAQFTAFFQGDTEKAEVTIRRLLELSKTLGAETLEIGRAFLPQVESLDQLEEVVKIATALARFQPEQGITGARIALQEFLAGETRSLVRRFEIPRGIANELQDVLQTQGLQAGLDALQAELARTGRSVEDLADTSDVAFGRIKESLRILGQITGEPIIEALKEEFNGLFETLDTRGVSIEQIANRLGELAGSVVELLGAGLRDTVENIDLTIFDALLEQAQGVVSAVRTLAEVSDLDIAFFINKTGFELAGLLKITRNTIIELSGLIAFIDALGVGLEAALINFERPGTVNPFAAFSAALDENLEALIRHQQRLEANRQAQRDFAQEQEDLAGLTEEGTDAFLAYLAALRDSEAAAAEAEEALEKVQGAIAKFNQGQARALEDIIIRQARANVDAEIENSQRRLDQEERNRRRLAEIGIQATDRELDAAEKLTRAEEDIFRDHARKRVDFEDSVAKDRIKIEENLIRELEAINRRFDQSQRDALRDNDARAFVRIQEQREFALNEARIGQQVSLQDAVTAARERREALNVELERELEDARLADTRRVADLETRLQRELDTRNRKNEEELADIETLEQRKLEEQQAANEQMLEDFNRTWKRRATDLENQYGEELIILKEFQGRELELIREHNENILRLTPQTRGFSSLGLGDTLNVAEADQATINANIDDMRDLATRLAREQGILTDELEDTIFFMGVPALRGLIQTLSSGLGIAQSGGGPRRFGGPLSQGGNRFEGVEPEIVSFNRSGFVTPMSRTFFSPPSPATGLTNNNFTFQNELVNPATVSPEMRAHIRAFFNEWFLDIVSSGVLVR